MSKEQIKILFSFILTTLIATFIISITHFITTPIIEENNLIRENKIVAKLFPNTLLEEIEPNFNNEEKEVGLKTIVKAQENYIYKAQVTGLFANERTTFIIVIDKNGNFSNFTIIESEDDWVGNIDAPQFRDRFIGEKYSKEFDGKDMQTQATLSATPVANAIMAAGNHYEREFLK